MNKRSFVFAARMLFCFGVAAGEDEQTLSQGYGDTGAMAMIVICIFFGMTFFLMKCWVNRNQVIQRADVQQQAQKRTQLKISEELRQARCVEGIGTSGLDVRDVSETLQQLSRPR